MSSVALLTFALATFLFHDVIQGRAVEPLSSQIAGSVGGLGIGAMGVWILLVIFRTRLTLHVDRLEYRGWRSAVSMPRDLIASWRIAEVAGIRCAEIQSTVANDKKLRIYLVFNSEPLIDNWFQDLANVDVIKESAKLQSSANDPMLGGNPHERLRRVAVIRRNAAWVMWGCVALMAWHVFFPLSGRPAAFVWIPMPWLALAVALHSRHQYQLFNLAELPWVLPASLAGRRLINLAVLQASLAPLLLLPTLVLCGQAVAANMVDWHQSIAPGFALALALILLAVPRSGWVWAHTGKLLWWASCSCMYGVAAIVVINVVFDQGTPALYATQVVKKRHERRTDPAYWTVAPWGPIATEEEIAVELRLYRTQKTGGSVCMALHSGLLGLPWYEVAAQCPAVIPTAMYQQSMDALSSAANGSSSKLSLAPLAKAATSHTLRLVPVESMYMAFCWCGTKPNCSTSSSSSARSNPLKRAGRQSQ